MAAEKYKNHFRTPFCIAKLFFNCNSNYNRDKIDKIKQKYCFTSFGENKDEQKKEIISTFS